MQDSTSHFTDGGREAERPRNLTNTSSGDNKEARYRLFNKEAGYRTEYLMYSNVLTPDNNPIHPSLPHSSHKYLLRAPPEPGAVLGAGDTGDTKAKSPALRH